jgi:hypothetical protein
VAAGTRILGSVGRFRDGFDVRSVPTLTIGGGLAVRRMGYRHWPQPDQECGCRATVKINMIKINLRAATALSRRCQPR